MRYLSIWPRGHCGRCSTFPSPELVVGIRVSEYLAIKEDSIQTINENEEVFLKRLRNKLGVRTKLPSFIATELGRNPVPLINGRNPFQVDSVPLEELRALKRQMQGNAQ